MTRWWMWLAGAVIGVGAGVVSAFSVLGNGQLLGSTEYDYWFGNEQAGSAAADPYTRGIIATIGLLALNRSETIYFHRYASGDGAPLREECDYEISGGVLPTRWWSITVYAEDDFLPVNGVGSASIDKDTVTRTADGGWTARVAHQRNGATDWITSENAGDFSFGLRMYNPEPGARDDANSIPFPTVRTIGCAGDAS